MMKKIAQFLPLCVLIAAASAQADPVTITFENPPCPTVGIGIHSGACYAQLGVLFSSAGPFPLFSQSFAITAEAHAVSPPNVAKPAPGFAFLNAEFFRFEPTVTASSVSFNIVGSQPGQPAWRVVFATGSFIDNIIGFGDQLVSAPRCCVRGLTFFPGSPVNAMDNLRFEPTIAATPEPATVFLIATGAVALLRRRRSAQAAAVNETRP
jgi:hypothetical protein